MRSEKSLRFWIPVASKLIHFPPMGMCKNNQNRGTPIPVACPSRIFTPGWSQTSHNHDIPELSQESVAAGWAAASHGGAIMIHHSSSWLIMTEKVFIDVIMFNVRLLMLMDTGSYGLAWSIAARWRWVIATKSDIPVGLGSWLSSQALTKFATTSATAWNIKDIIIAKMLPEMFHRAASGLWDEYSGYFWSWGAQ